MGNEETAIEAGLMSATLLIDRELWKRFDAVAQANGRSKNGELRQLVKSAVTKHERGLAA